MADYDLEALTLSELKKMQKDVAKAISTYEDRQKAEARAKVEALARELGYSLAELVGTETKSSRAPAVAKYRHPENPALIWSGRGRKPQWLVEALDEGKTVATLPSAEGLNFAIGAERRVTPSARTAGRAHLDRCCPCFERPVCGSSASRVQTGLNRCRRTSSLFELQPS